jgi:hypothetical protein
LGRVGEDLYHADALCTVLLGSNITRRQDIDAFVSAIDFNVESWWYQDMTEGFVGTRGDHSREIASSKGIVQM